MLQAKVLILRVSHFVPPWDTPLSRTPIDSLDLTPFAAYTTPIWGRNRPPECFCVAPIFFDGNRTIQGHQNRKDDQPSGGLYFTGPDRRHRALGRHTIHGNNRDR